MGDERKSEGVGTLSERERSLLLNKGNAFFQEGEIENAKRVFLTLHYAEGLIRVGNHYLAQGRIPDALRMYKSAPSPEHVAALSKKIASLIRTWLAG